VPLARDGHVTTGLRLPDVVARGEPHPAPQYPQRGLPGALVLRRLVTRHERDDRLAQRTVVATVGLVKEFEHGSDPVVGEGAQPGRPMRCPSVSRYVIRHVVHGSSGPSTRGCGHPSADPGPGRGVRRA
jgi:hypothetical protein